MRLVIGNSGLVRCRYDEVIDLGSLGRMTIVRASRVEPDEYGRWLADLSPANGPKLGPFSRRSQALEAEADWLETNRLDGP